MFFYFSGQSPLRSISTSSALIWLLKIPYRKIRTDFDKVVASSYIFEPVVFYKGTDKVLELAYEDNVTADGIETGTLEIRYKEKVFSTDNEKTSYTLFLEIKETVLRQA